MKKILLIIFIISLSNAYAGMLAEPYLTFLDKTKADDSDNSEVRGTTLGLRLAYNNPLYYVGIDYEKGLESEWIASNNHREVNTVNNAFLFGYRPIPIFQSWFKYYFKSIVEQDSALDLGGKGIGLGFALTVRPNLSFFTEYKNIKYDVCSPESSCSAGEINLKGFVFGVSFPFIN